MAGLAHRVRAPRSAEEKKEDADAREFVETCQRVADLASVGVRLEQAWKKCQQILVRSSAKREEPVVQP